ncbi:hypothetical protein ACVI1J_004750 [Bradyrhizobium diazoefficiens]
MKRLFLGAIVALSVSGSAQAADQTFGLEEIDYKWLVKAIGAIYVANNCGNGYKVDYEGSAKWGDLNGADIKHIAPALLAIINSVADKPYKRSDIDARVTRAYYAIGEEIMNLEKDGKASMCAQFTEYAVRDNFVKKR